MLRLDGGGQTLLLALRQGPPVVAYWGEALPVQIDAAAFETLAPKPRAGSGTLDGGEVFDLFPEAGRGFTGHPALELSRPDGSFVTQLKFEASSATRHGHAIQLADPEAAIAVEIDITLDPATGVAAFESLLTNRASDP